MVLRNFRESCQVGHADDMTLTVTKVIGTREDVAYIFSLERKFIDKWLKKGEGKITQMPHMPDLGSGVRFHLANVEAWLLEYHQVGGNKAAAGQRKLRQPRSNGTPPDCWKCPQCGHSIEATATG